MKYFVPPGSNVHVPVPEEVAHAKTESGGKRETLPESLHGESRSSGKLPESEPEGGSESLDVPTEDSGEEIEEDLEDVEDDEDE